MEPSNKFITIRELIALIQTDGGHVLLALFLMFAGLFCLVHWQVEQGKELFAFAMGLLGYALKRNTPA